jgi:hypothetical protein
VTTTPPADHPSLTDAQLDEALALAADADSVELKLTVPESDQRSAVAALGMDPLDGQIRQVYFLDTPDLALNAVGVVARVRRVQKRGDDSVVKLRPVVPADLPKKLRSSPDVLVEVDAMPGGYVCSASFKGALGPEAVKEAVAGTRPIRKLFSKQQRAFYAAHAPENLDLDALTLLGPLNVLKLRFAPKDFDRKLVAEMWFYPDGSRILELSLKCAPADAVSVAAATRAFLVGRGIDVSGEQQTKTKTALGYYADIARDRAATAR